MAALCIHNDGEDTSYELLAELPRGGEGRTWKALQIGADGRSLPVAVKVLTPEAHLGTADVDRHAVLRRWRAQMQIMRNFSHEGFASVQVAFAITACPTEPSRTLEWMIGLPAFVMQWLDGPPLDAWSRQIADPHARLSVLALCARGLDAFHRETRCVHCDLKPSNVVVVAARGRIIDFGLVRSLEHLRSRSAAAGSPGYLAPELYDGAEYTARTDHYAFAGILVHQLLRHHPNPTLPAAQIRAQLHHAGFHAAADLLTAALDPDPRARPAGLDATTLLDRTMHAEERAPPVTISLGDEDGTVDEVTPCSTFEVPTAIQPPPPDLTAPPPRASSRAAITRILSVIAVTTGSTVVLVLLLRSLTH